jgi:tRNA threonylcarbamoyladenosine biosynthesis protein TsaE
MTAARQREFRMTSETAQRTAAIGCALGRLLAPGDVICVAGELGAGKTVFSRGIGVGWGARPPLSSPTYNLVHEHERPADNARLYHLDLYRVSGAREAETLGIHEILDSGDPVIFEWPERVLDFLPAEHLWIDITMREDDRRDLLLEARGERYVALINALPRKLSKARQAAGHVIGD